VTRTIGSLDVNHIVIVESLPAGESKTGTDLYQFLSNLPSVQNRKIPISLYSVESEAHFHELMGSLIQSAKNSGMLPIVHIECHGDEDELQFADGSCMSYLRVSRLLLQLNRATSLNLVASFAACFGGYFLRQMELLRRCPVRLMIGPTEEVTPHELRTGFITFYKTIFDTLSISDAQSRIEVMTLSNGMWVVETAEGWYFRVAANHLVTECSKVALKRRARDIHERKTRLVGSSGWSEREIYFRLRAHTRKMLLDRYYRRFFMVHPIPANAERFREARIELQRLMLRLRRKGTHAV
jgi:hypothetical protein